LEHQLILTKSKRATRTAVWQYMMWEAERLLSDLPGVRGARDFETMTWEVDGRVLIRFKHVSPQGLSANYPTKRARSFTNDDQCEIFEEMWSAPLRVDVGYVLDETGLDAARVLVVRRRGADVDWVYEVEPPATGVLVVPIEPVAPLTTRPGVRIVARHNLPDTGEVAQ
jgi:hypothetical protein